MMSRPRSALPFSAAGTAVARTDQAPAVASKLRRTGCMGILLRDKGRARSRAALSGREPSQNGVHSLFSGCAQVVNLPHRFFGDQAELDGLGLPGELQDGMEAGRAARPGCCHLVVLDLPARRGLEQRGGAAEGGELLWWVILGCGHG